MGAENTETPKGSTDEGTVETTAPEAEVKTETPVQAEATQKEEPQAGESTEAKSLLADAEEDEAKAPESEDKSEEEAPKQEEFTPVTKEQVKFPEGTNVNEAVLESYLELTNELKLNAEQAQKLVDLKVKSDAEAAEAQAKAANEQYADWEKTLKSNPNYADNLLMAKKALTLMPDEMKEAAMSHPSYNWPPMQEFLARVGKLVSEGNFVDGNGSGSSQKSPQQIMYPNMPTRS